jgi:hypothetical protein
MEVHGSFKSKVEIDPLDVIEGLIEKKMSLSDYVYEKDGKYYMNVEHSAGSHSIYMDEEIDENEYIYLKALHTVRTKLKNV